MNLVSFLLNTGLSLFYIPFSDNRSSENIARSDSQSEVDISSFPFNLLRRNPACTTLDIVLGENHLKFTTIPRSSCSNCCPIKIPRDIKFTLFNKNHSRGTPITPMLKSGAAKKAGVNPDWHTIIFIHGFSEPSPGQSGKAIVDAYLTRPENYNIILLDWGELACFPWYRAAVQNVKIVGKVLRNFIKLFNETGELLARKVHIIGFSLGCHIASVAGKGLQETLRIPRITALDPAFPEFPLEDRSKRLVETDADYIDVIHTDGGVFGFPYPIGHADFYPNGGQALQPGCQPSYLAQNGLADRVLACSHIRAWQLYAESVRNPAAFQATRCQNWRGSQQGCNFTVDAFMGFGNNNTFGEFYLKTSFKSPYGLNVQQQIS